MKTIKDLKIGDICYLLDAENEVSEVKVVSITESELTGRHSVTFDFETPFRVVGTPTEEAFYSVSGNIFLEVAPVIQLLSSEVRSIQKTIKRLKREEE